MTTKLGFKGLKRVLIANRGEIACRIIQACEKNSIFSITIFSKDDAKSPHVTQADEAYLLSGTGSLAYIDTENIIDIAKKSKADGIIPGYGFLSENHEFAHQLEREGILFIGPSPEVIERFGLKHIARQLAMEAKVPIVPGTGLINDVETAQLEASRIGYPVLLKASAGGGGVGMKICRNESEVANALVEVKSRSSTLFKNDSIFLEKYVEQGRHIEIQVFGNGMGQVIVLGERECSIQRRHQKVIEESPSPFVLQERHINLRQTLSSCAHRLATSVDYKSAGTIEFLVDNLTGEFYFLEMNTRLQVEHGITELTYNVDLVTLMLLQADFELSGEKGIPQDILYDLGGYKPEQDGWPQPQGHSIEARIYAENPIKRFAPSPGVLQLVESMNTNGTCKVRFDHWIQTGTTITPFFDPLLGKLMIWAPSRNEAIEGIITILKEIKILGPPNNIEYCASIINDEKFRSGLTLTNMLDTFEFTPTLLEFVSGGALTTVQDYPGRINMNGGIPRSGPLDDVSFQIANGIVGNELGTEALEFIFIGPELWFHKSATIALCGSKFEFKINGKEQPMWTSLSIPAGARVEIGKACSNLSDKAYLSIRGGLPNIAPYLGSKSTTPGLNIGGYQGRKFLTGDCISLPEHELVSEVRINYKLPSCLIPQEPYDGVWSIRCLNGPHCSEEIMGNEGRSILYDNEYKINPNTTRGSIALDGPKCVFSRRNGGDGGNNPSNIIEYIYPNRGLSTVADNTVVAGPDGITLSGFVCPIVPIEVDWWKLGQAKVGTKVKFENITYEDALKLKQLRREYLQMISSLPQDNTISFNDKLIEYQPTTSDDVIIYHRDEQPGFPLINIRQAGESAMIIDHGVTTFSLSSCARLYKMNLDLAESLKNRGLLRIEPANGSLTIFFDPMVLPRSVIINLIIELDKTISFESNLQIPSRKYRLPVSMNHPLIDETITRYTKTQRPYAAYLPSNLKYVMESSCIDTIEEFKRRAFNSPQVILAVSFLCASNLMVHLDPRKSFISGKYNPPRTSGPAGSVTTGSVVQGMRAVDGPGGYMLWGIGLRHAFWDTYSMRANFRENNLPWFLQPFDQVEFYEVTNDQLDELNELNQIGRYHLTPEITTFDVAEYYKFQQSVKPEVTSLRIRQSEAAANLLRKDNKLKAKWEAELEQEKLKVQSQTCQPEKIQVLDGIPLKSSMTASVFKIHVNPGDIVKPGTVAIVLEAMKTEIPILIPQTLPNYKVMQVLVTERALVSPDETLVVLQ